MPSTFFSPLTLPYEGTQLCKHQNTGRAKGREKINKFKKKEKRSTWSTCWAVAGRVWWEGRWRVRQDDEVPGGGVGSAIERTLSQGHLISSLQIASLWVESSHEKIGGLKIWGIFHKTPNIQLKKI